MVKINANRSIDFDLANKFAVTANFRINDTARLIQFSTEYRSKDIDGALRFVRMGNCTQLIDIVN